MVEIDYMTNGVYDGKKKCSASDHFVEWYVRVQWYILLYGEVF